jgi:membrane-associated phospholipid phosphatase
MAGKVGFKMIAPASGQSANPTLVSPADRHYRFIDTATQAYLLVVGLLILFFHNQSVPDYPLLLLAHGAAVLVIHTLIRSWRRFPQNRMLSFLRHFYPLLLYAFLYKECEWLNLMFVDRYLDPFFIRLEEALFGFQPAVAFMAAFHHPVLSEFFYLSYFTYYLMIAGVGLALFFRNRPAFWHFVAVLSFVLYVCFLAFIFLPVAGPPAFYMEIPRFADQHLLPYYPLEFPLPVTKGPFFQLMAFIYRHFESGGAAFPSSHVAVALGTLSFSWRYLPRIRLLHLAGVAALSLATVYCRYHYAVDVIAGAAAAAMLIPIGEWFYRRWP